jgi:protein SCO1/2
VAGSSRFALLALLALVLAGCGGSAVAGPAHPEQTAKTFRGSELDPPMKTTDFRLRDQDGKPVSLAVQRGRLAIVTFLYTHCVDVCPLIAEHLNLALRQLKPAERAKVRVLAISVDPKGDTPKAVRQFVYSHRLLPEFRYLTGTRKQLAPVWHAFHIAVSANPETVDHSAYEVLVDQQGAGRVIYDAQVRPAQVVHDVRVLLRS